MADVVPKTTLQIRPIAYLRVNLLNAIRFKARLFLGAMISECLDAFRIYQNAKAEAVRSELTSDSIASCTAGNDDFFDRALRGAADIALAPRHRLSMESFDERVAEGGVTSALNIGCRVDNMVPELARRHPEVAFTSVDFGTRLVETNRALYGDIGNWRIVSGYPLALIRSGEVGGDVAFLCGVTTVLSNAEYRAYLQALHPVSRFLIVSDLWTVPATSINPFRIWRPEDIDPVHSPVIAFFGGGRYLHNHPAVVLSSGYDVVSCALHGDGSDHCYTVHLVARRRESSDRK